MSLGTPDLIIAGMIVLSILIGIARGFVKESISLVTWIVAIVLSILYSGSLAEYMTFTKVTLVRSLTAFLLIFLSIIFAGAIVNYTVGTLVRKTPFSAPDRVLGFAFGFLRGVVFVSILVLLAGLTPLPEAPWWQGSYMVSRFQVFAIWLKDRLPDEHAKVFHFPGEPGYTQEKELDQA